MTKTMKASECKAKFLAMLDEVARTPEPATASRSGTSAGRIVPVVNKPGMPVGGVNGVFEIKGDIVGPLGDI